jgi:hypothetical protein
MYSADSKFAFYHEVAASKFNKYFQFLCIGYVLCPSKLGWQVLGERAKTKTILTGRLRFDSGRGQRIFSLPPRPYLLWGTPSILLNECLGAFFTGKNPGLPSWLITFFYYEKLEVTWLTSTPPIRLHVVVCKDIKNFILFTHSWSWALLEKPPIV